MSDLLRVAVVTSHCRAQAWEAAMIAELAALENIELTLPTAEVEALAVPSFYRWYERLDNRIFGMFDDPCSEATIDAKTAPGTSSDTFDFIILLRATRPQATEYLPQARHGVLYYDSIDEAGNRLLPMGYHEVMQRWKTSSVIIRCLTPDAGERIVYRSRSSTDAISPRRNREQMLWKAAAFIPRLLRHFNGISLPEAAVSKAPVTNVTQGHPRGLQVLAGITHKLPDVFRFYYNAKLTQEQWYLLFQFSDCPETDLNRFTTIMPPRDRIWADPHIFFRDGDYHVFIEEMLFSENKGFISVFQIHEDGSYSQPVKVLERGYHLSYPQVFEWEDEIYMLPESSANRTIELYRCIRFPDQWTLETTLMRDIDAVDSSLLHRDARWWLFSSIKPHAAASENDELHLFSSSDFRSSDWEPHRGNPVISDTTRARPAGKPFEHEGKTIRPSQNCAGIYGFGFNLNKIICCTDDDYQESISAATTADMFKGMIATHTYAREGRLTVVDACRRISKLKSPKAAPSLESITADQYESVGRR